MKKQLFFFVLFMFFASVFVFAQQQETRYVVTITYADEGGSIRTQAFNILSTSAREAEERAVIQWEALKQANWGFKFANAETQHESTTPTVRTYKIGDTGPGGGIIFFAEGGHYIEVSGELGSTQWPQCKTTAQDHRGGGFSDWKLPTRAQLDMIYQNLKMKNLGNFTNDIYHSSDTGNFGPLMVYFSDGSLYINDRNFTGRTRAVRAFNP